MVKLRTLVAPTSYWQTSNYTRIKNNKRLLLKPFGYKVITIFITHGYCFQTWEESWGHLDTSKHKYSCIMTIASKALHNSKQNLGSGCRALAPSILHYFQAPPISNFQVMCCACESNVSSFDDLYCVGSCCRIFHKTHWGSFFLHWDKTKTKM